MYNDDLHAAIEVGQVRIEIHDKTQTNRQGGPMKVELLRVTPFGDDLAGQAAATCTRSDHPDKARAHALMSGHESILEHIVFTFRIEEISRVTLAQLTRHRLASFEVESQRYTDTNQCSVIMPPSIAENDILNNEYLHLVERSRAFYEKAVFMGIPKEDARFANLEGTCTRLILTMNARELRHFFSLRCCNRAQWEIRELADRMLKICKQECPAAFEDAGPGCVRHHCPELRPCGHERTHDWDGENHDNG